MSNPDTWMPLYVSRYLGDTGHLTVAEHGAYLLLLMQYWVRGPLPDDDRQLAIMAKTDIKVWRKGIGQTIRQFFIVRDDGRLHQKRADAELAKADEIIQKKRAAANTRWGSDLTPPPTDQSPPGGDHSAHAKAMHVHSTSSPRGKQTQSISNASAVQMQCPLPVPVQKEEILSYLDSGSKPRAYAPAREAGPSDLVEIRQNPPPTADEIAAVSDTVAKLTTSLTMRAYPPGKWQRLSEAEQRAIAETLPPPPKPLSPEHLAVLRQRAGYGSPATERSHSPGRGKQLRVVA